MSRDIAFAVLGAGRIGALHADNLARAISGARLAAVMDADLERAQAVAGPGYATDSLDRIMADGDIDAVLIASPTAAHAPQMIAAARAGKAIFCEKPVSLDLARAIEAVDAVRTAKVPFQIGFQRRYDHGFAAARQHLDEGAIGRLEMFRALTCDPEPAPFAYLATSGGIYADMAIHDIDIARFYGGDIVEVTAMGEALIVPELQTVSDVDTSILTFRFASGAIGVIQNSRRATYGYEIRTELLGAEGKLVIEEERATPIRLYNRTGIHGDFHGWFIKRFRDAYRAEVEAFVSAVRDGRPASPGLDDALASLRVALAATRSLKERRSVRVEEVG